MFNYVVSLCNYDSVVWRKELDDVDEVKEVVEILVDGDIINGFYISISKYYKDKNDN